MKFEESFNITFEKFKKRDEINGVKFSINPATAKILAFAWNMIANAKGKLDDNVFINKNNNIISFDKEKLKKATKPKTLKQNKSQLKDKTANPDPEKDLADDASESTKE